MMEFLSVFSATRMVYERHPYDGTVKRFSVQVINPDGGESSVYRVSAP